MARKRQSNNNNNKKDKQKQKSTQENTRKSTKKLKKLSVNQSDTPAPVKQPVVPASEQPVAALKNIQKQLNHLTTQRKDEQNRLAAFKKEIRTIKKHLNELDNELLDTVANDKSSHELLKKLKQFKKHFDKKLKQFDRETRLLTQEISLFTNLEQRVIKRIETLEQQLEQAQQPWQKQLDYLGVSYNELFDKISHFETELSRFDQKLDQPDQGLNEFADSLEKLQQQVQEYIQQIQVHEEEQDTRLNLLQTDTTNIHQSLQQIQTLQQDKEQDFQQFENRLNSLQDAQQQLITPLEQQLNELGNELQLLKQSIAEQQTEEPSSEKALDDERFNALAQQVEQFDSLLKQSHEELKTHIQSLRDSDQTAQSEQTDQLRKQLKQLEQQLTEVAEQSTQLQTLFSDIQDQQSLEQQQSKELSEQVQTQQLQLNELDEQLQQFNPLLENSQNPVEQLDSLTRTIEQLQAEQVELNSSEQITEKKLGSLSSKLEQHYNDVENRLEQLHNAQLDQKTQLHNYHQFQYQQQNQHKELSGELNHLSAKIKSRSQLFGIGLISVLAISALLVFTQDRLQTPVDKQSLTAQIKTEVKNETFSKINALTKQNSIILNDQLTQIRQSIKEIKAQQSQEQSTLKTPQTKPEITTDTATLNSKPQQELLQNRLAELEVTLKKELQEELQKELNGKTAGLKEEQSQLKQSVSHLSEKVSQIDSKVAELEKNLQTPSQTTNPSNITKPSAKKQAIIPVSSITTPFYAVQVSGSYQTASIKDFMLKYQLVNKAAIYQTELNNKPWFIVLIGNYQNFNQARQAIKALPEDLKQLKPWVRKLP